MQNGAEARAEQFDRSHQLGVRQRRRVHLKSDAADAAAAPGRQSPATGTVAFFLGWL